jgi:SAM-dependent methyltransferase
MGSNAPVTDAKQFPFPIPPGFDEQPVWTGRGFQVGEKLLPILAYELGDSGWTDELTLFHENTAGADHFIDRSSREHALSRVRKAASGPSPSIIEIGCSSGFVLKLMRQTFPSAMIVGADYVGAPLRSLAREIPDLPLLQFDLTNCPLPDASFDIVVLLNVLEHIEDDNKALAHVARILKPGGTAIIEVPAGPHLYDVYDKQLQHFRRYRLGDLVHQVEAAGLTVAEKSHLGFFIYPGFWWTKKRGQRRLGDSENAQREIVARDIKSTGNSRLMYSIMRLEASLRNSIFYPWGIRCLVSCTK